MEKCPACDHSSYIEVYSGPIRSGSYGKMTEESHSIVRCEYCSLDKLSEFIVAGDEYESSEYRESYNDTSNDEKLLQMHDYEQPNRANIIGLSEFRGKTVCDLGSGHGSFLDSIKGVAQTTIAIEPFSGLHQSLQSRSHKPFSYASEAMPEWEGMVDIVASFGVIEHVPHPGQYLEDAWKLLKKGGVMILQTDNNDDILMKSGARDFLPFFYRTAHNWYFNSKNLEMLFKKHNFNNIDIKTSHHYDFSNFLLWHRDGKPTGNGSLQILPPTFDAIWKSFLEDNGLGELITVCAYKN